MKQLQQSPILFLVALLPSLFIGSQMAEASGWVKGKGAYYFKLEHSNTLERSFDSEIDGFNESNRTQSIYAETGIDSDPIPLQFSLYSALKSIYRRDPALGDGFLSRAMTDSRFNVKFEAVNLALGPVQWMLAPHVGAMFPTTPQRYRVGQEEERQDEVPADRSFLVASVDRGRSGGELGLGTTFYLAPGWLNLAGSRQQGGDWSQSEGSLALGVGLPLNSWAQLSYSRTVSEEEMDSDDAAQTAVSATNTATMSLGFTAYKGLAIEPRYSMAMESDDRWDRSVTWGLGLSYRSL